jgi:hypothetical protein
VIVFAEGGWKGVIWLPEGCKGGGWARVAGELRKTTSFLGSKERKLGSETFSSDQLGGSSYVAVFRGLDASHVMHAGKQRSVDDLDNGRQTGYCLALEEQLHWSTERSNSRGLLFDSLVKGLFLCALGEKKTCAFHSARGTSSPRLNSNQRAWIRLLVGLNLALG